MLHQFHVVIRTVHIHRVQRKYWLMKSWYDSIFLLIQEETQFQHYQHLSISLVVQMKGWVIPS